MKTLLDFLAGTPIYAYVGLFYLLFVGIKASRERVVSIYKLFIVPAVLLYLSFSTLSRLDLTFYHYSLFSSLLICMGFIGWSLVTNKEILVDKKKKQISIPGSWVTLIIVLLIFISKYYSGYKHATDPSFILSPQDKLLSILMLGFSLGLIFGRLANYLYRYRTGKHKDLLL